MSFPKDVCPICTLSLTQPLAPLGSSSVYTGECLRCGSYRFPYTVVDELKAIRARFPELMPVISHEVRQLSETHGAAYIESNRLMVLYKEQRTLPDPIEQGTNVLRWLGRQTKGGIPLDLPIPHGMAIVGCDDGQTVRWVVDYLESEGLVKSRTVKRERQLATGTVDHYEAASICLTMPGWERYFELLREAGESRLAFMAMDFRHDDELKAVFLQCFKPAVEAAGFTLRRLDENPPAGSIDDRLQVEIRRSRFVVCDLTYDNSGAYWEAGFAKGLGRPVFYTCRDTSEDRQHVHFDTRQQYIVFWTPGWFQDAGQRLTDSIRATIADATLGRD